MAEVWSGAREGAKGTCSFLGPFWETGYLAHLPQGRAEDAFLQEAGRLHEYFTREAMAGVSRGLGAHTGSRRRGWGPRGRGGGASLYL